MKKYFLIIALLVWSVAAFAQIGKIPQRLELVTVDLEVGNEGSLLSTQENLEVFNMPVDGVNHYWLSVGHLGLGDDIIQFNIDPIYELFIPIGDTVADALEYLQTLQAIFKGSRGDSMEVIGCLSAAFPNGQMEKVTVTYQKLLVTSLLEFRVDRNGYMRATHIPKSQFNSLVSSLKVYRKLHRKEP
ncbi:MAG: hypothetical protein J5771_03500 [Bacteroidales bacterium]|nr:hypothetical protein [Bacteroidales bacterium]